MTETSRSAAPAGRDVAALQTAVAAGDPVAAARVRRALPSAAAAHALAQGRLDDAPARTVLAREAGFADWAALRDAVDVERLAEGNAEAALVDALFAGDASRSAAILQRWPRLPEESPACALAMGRPAAFRRLAIDANAPLRPRDLPPLLYLCSSRHAAGDADVDTVRLEIADALIAAGADVNAGMREAETIRGYRTALGAAIECARSPALAKRLLAAGADVADGPTLYEGCAMWAAVRHADVASLEALLAGGPPQWHVCHALPHALRWNDLALTQLLLAPDGDPNWTMGAWNCKGSCLHEAVMLDCEPAILEALLAGGAQVDFADRDGRTPLAVATCLNRHALADVLRRHGAAEDRIRPVDGWVAACFAGDADRAKRLAAGLDGRFKAVDHLWACRAIGRAGSGAPSALRVANNHALELLLAGGIAADAVDDDGESALHLAAAGNAAAVRALLAQGADASALNFAGETPLAAALRLGQDESAGLLAEHAAAAGIGVGSLPEAGFNAAFEAAADAVAAGDVQALATMLAARPQLATARSSRPHRCTLLNYLGANGFEHWRQRTPANAVAIAECLLAAGADPNATCYTYRGGPGQHTLGLLTSSDKPKAAGLALPLVAALARGGAELDDVYQLLAGLHAAAEDDELAAAAQRLDADAPSTQQAIVECASLGETTLLFALLDAGASIDACRADGATALHQAAIDGNAALVDALLARGADPRRRDKVFNGNAAGWANAGGHPALAKRLTEAAKA